MTGSGPPADRKQALRWVEEASAERSVERLAAALEHPHTRVREAAIESLGRLGGPSTGPAVVRALGDDDAFVRAAAVAALPELLDRDAAVSHLIEALRDEEDLVRGRSAHALVEVDSERAVEPLLRMLHEEPAGSPAQRTAAAVLDRMGAGRVSGRVRGPLGSTLLPWAVGLALFSLGVILAGTSGMGLGAGAAGVAGFLLLVVARMRSARAAGERGFFHPAGELGGGEAVWLGYAAGGGSWSELGGGDGGGDGGGGG